MLQKIKDEIEYAILKFIEYDNKHHCFRYFVLGFSICSLLYSTALMIVSLSLNKL